MNVTVLIGRLTKDVELRFAAGSGTAVARFTLAVNRQFKKDEADFISCIAFGKTGETIAQYITKGQQLAIKGHIQTGSFEAQDGTRRYTTDVIVDSFDFISSNNNQNSNGVGGAFATPDNSFNENDIMPIDNGDIPF
ncbi:TPA: single-stranded DNA-binding protein [Clostridium perfringens]|uniref:single-stranded DNA-binding protein n=1 Tax=Clostridium perfringens TaxID=1502 RepID=UPI001A249E2E|nr:single-stranded DNA-binding protein [Clostridium perfringens]EHR1332464.1 single-stranded DNA-binding protein [Clostridium perfringens]EHR1426044.1 single-stranded DNA-binding protein [Clostridium perfringens]HAT4343461.1 single-stranded DNA-binding protein [Clostridium perfringens]